MRLQFWIGRIRVSFSFWFFAVVLLFVLLDAEVLAWYIALPVILHEFGHLIAMALCRVRVQAVEFTPFSISIKRQEMLAPGGELVVQLGGVLANCAAALVLYTCFFQSMRTMFLIAANLAVALFNLLPIGNLDGGTVCKLLCRRFFSPDTARRVSRLVSFAVLTPLFAAAIFLILSGSGNFTLLVSCIYLAVVVIFRE